MSDFKDKDDTFVFKPETEEKPHINRTEDDQFSYARKSVEYEEEEESTSPLVITAIVLAVLLVAAIVGGIIYLSSMNNNKPPTVEKPPVVSVEEEEEKEEEEEIIETDYNLIFDSEQIFYMESGKGYAVSTDYFDKRDKFIKKEMSYITDETVIKDNGKRISVEAFINIIKNQGGDLILFKSVVREEDSMVVSITYDSRTFAPEEPPEEIIPEEIVPEEIIPEETTPDETAPEEEVKEEVNREEGISSESTEVPSAE